MASFFNPSGNALGVGGDPVQVIAATAGATVQLRRGSSFYINNAGTLATLTVKLPAAERGQECVVSFKGAVTALTVQDRAGVAVPGAPAAGVANSAISFIYVNKAIGWVNWT